MVTEGGAIGAEIALPPNLADGHGGAEEIKASQRSHEQTDKR